LHKCLLDNEQRAKLSRDSCKRYIDELKAKECKAIDDGIKELNYLKEKYKVEMNKYVSKILEIKNRLEVLNIPPL